MTALRTIAFAIGSSVMVAGTVHAQAPVPGLEIGPPGADRAVPPAQGPKRQPKDPIVEVESKFIELPEEVAKTLGVLPMATAAVPKGGAAAGKQPLRVPSAPVPAVAAVLPPDVAQKLLQQLNEASGANLLSAPKVAVRSGQRAVVEMIREFRYPTEFEFERETKIFTPKAFETRNVGITMEVQPTVGPDSTIDLNLAPQVVRLEGYIRASDGQPVPLRNGRSVGADLTIKDFAPVQFPRDTVLSPVFATNKVTTSIAVLTGHTIVLGGFKREVREDGKKPESRILYVLVTARVMAWKDVPAAVLPVAIVDKADEEGFVRSPFAPGARPIDARGLPSGTELECPVTRQVFRVP